MDVVAEHHSPHLALYQWLYLRQDLSKLLHHPSANAGFGLTQDNRFPSIALPLAVQVDLQRRLVRQWEEVSLELFPSGSLQMNPVVLVEVGGQEQARYVFQSKADVFGQAAEGDLGASLGLGQFLHPFLSASLGLGQPLNGHLHGCLALL